MSVTRDRMYQDILTSIAATNLPDPLTGPLRAALDHLFTNRPNAVDKIQAPLGRALRNPAFPEIWAKCVSDIPDTPAYADLRAAADAIATHARGLKHRPGAAD